ncbi:YqaA family protein [Chitinivorax sp. PXF-14]|uniref:YqaA family protein n=1 Tax=Chitinivorax sp. PXF-14 TaxID=3230488 RepID=UPI0034651E1F
MAGLFISAFVSATVLPGNSELALLAILKLFPQQWTGALIVATLGNTLGGMTSYWLGCLAPRLEERRGVACVKRWGAWSLLLSWVPIVGDALCLAAGWLRLGWLACSLAMLVGKGARYAAIAYLSL